MEAKAFAYSKDFIEALHVYLLKKPMEEVEGLVLGLRQGKPVDFKEEALPEKTTQKTS